MVQGWKSGESVSSSSVSVIQRALGVQKLPIGEVWSGDHVQVEKCSKMEMLRNGCSLNDLKCLSAKILAPYMGLKSDVIYESYEGLKSLVNSIFQLTWFEF